MIMSRRTEQCRVWKRFYLEMKPGKMFLFQWQQAIYFFQARSKSKSRKNQMKEVEKSFDLFLEHLSYFMICDKLQIYIEHQ